MARINVYLTFNGNCREAMAFYQYCLGGELSCQPIGESPMADSLPPSMKDSLLHATLTTPDLLIMGSDMVSEQGLVRGNAISLMLNCQSEEEVKTLYTNLATGGNATHPLEDTFWGALFGGLTDQFGNCWLLHFDRQMNP